jgi:hypothetical protein
MIGRKKGKKLGTKPVTALYIGTRYFVDLGNGVAGNEIGFTKMKWDSHDEQKIPFPPEMWFATEMLNSLAQCECRSHGERGCKYYYPGWSYNTDEQLSIDFDVVRFEAASGRFWLWFLNGERDELNHREYGYWKD